MRPLRHLDFNDIPALEVSGKVDYFAQVVYGIGRKQDRDYLACAPGVGHRDAGVQLGKDIVAGRLEHAPAGDFLGIGQHHGRAVLPGKRLGTERPAGADYQVAGHPEGCGFIEDHLEHIYPLLTKPGKFLGIKRFRTDGELDGIDLHATYPLPLEHPQFAHELIGLHPVAVPPPAHERPVGIVGTGETPGCGGTI